MGLPGESIPVIVEPLELPAPARGPDREKQPAEPVPSGPRRSDEEPALR
jgi:hypothetical protein